MDKRSFAAAISVVSNSVLVAAKLVVGLLTGSVSVISEAAHSALDLFAAVIALFSVRICSKPADHEHPFGHGKFENLSGAIEAFLILLAAIFIIHESLDKLRNPHAVETPEWGLIVMGVSVVVNTFVSRYLFKVAKQTDSVALEADAHHLSTDVWTSIGVFVGLGILKMTNWHAVDPIIAIAVALMIMRVAFSLTWKAAGPLLDQKLPDEELKEVRAVVMSNPRVVGYHKLRTRKSGPYREIDYHLIVPGDISVEEAHSIAEHIEDEIRRRYPEAHVVTHIEPDNAETIDEPGTHIRKKTPKGTIDGGQLD
ncbi:MAG: cation diffusion facilitator family transporter [Armatimonadota bacterium]|nr:cation diffusion facilitator family transporter [Armatimonadota bacterium]